MSLKCQLCYRIFNCVTLRLCIRVLVEVSSVFSPFLTCICLTAGVNLLTPSGHRQIRDVITTGIDMCGRRMRKGGGDGPYIRRGAD